MEQESTKQNYTPFIRKLHSFAGVFPLGIFLCFHMLVNYSANWGSAPYDTMGSFMAHMPYKIVLETFIIFLPLLFHAFYGVYLAFTSSVTVGQYTYFRNWRYVFNALPVLLPSCLLLGIFTAPNYKLNLREWILVLLWLRAL